MGKTIEVERARATADERPGEAGEEAVGRGRGGRMSRQRKTATVLRLLRGATGARPGDVGMQAGRCCDAEEPESTVRLGSR